MKKETTRQLLIMRLYGWLLITALSCVAILWGRYPGFFLKSLSLCNRCSFKHHILVYSLFLPHLRCPFLRISYAFWEICLAEENNH